MMKAAASCIGAFALDGKSTSLILGSHCIPTATLESENQQLVHKRWPDLGSRGIQISLTNSSDRDTTYIGIH